MVTETRRRPLKIHPEPEAMLEELVRALERIADGLELIVSTLDSVVVVDRFDVASVRVWKE